MRSIYKLYRWIKDLFRFENKEQEQEHILLWGKSGAGMVSPMAEMLREGRGRSNRAIIIDTSGGFSAKFCREGKEHILNPFDQNPLDDGVEDIKRERRKMDKILTIYSGGKNVTDHKNEESKVNIVKNEGIYCE